MTEKERAQYLDAIFDYVDSCFIYGEFDVVDRIIQQLSTKVDIMDDTILIGYLTITASAKSKLPSRKEFFRLAQERFKNDEPRLLQGLE